jgi:hypothetical protein
MHCQATLHIQTRTQYHHGQACQTVLKETNRYIRTPAYHYMGCYPTYGTSHSIVLYERKGLYQDSNYIHFHGSILFCFECGDQGKET